jgi:Tfp pilus assembly protein PilO
MAMSIKQVAFFGVLLAVPVASYFLVFQPQNDGIARAKQEIALKQQTLEKLREATARTADLKRANEQIQQSIASVSERLPSGKELDSVLRDVAQIAAKHGLEVPQFKRSDKSMPAGPALEQPLTVSLRGDFDGVYKFFIELEQLHRIVRVTDMKLRRLGDKVVEADGQIEAALTLSIFYEGGETKPASPLPGKTQADAGAKQ